MARGGIGKQWFYITYLHAVKTVESNEITQTCFKKSVEHFVAR